MSGPLGSVVSVSASDSHTCATFTSGTAYCWGANAQGQLGTGTTQNRLTPALVVNLPKTVCRSVELRITGYYETSPAIRELEIYGKPADR